MIEAAVKRDPPFIEACAEARHHRHVDWSASIPWSAGNFGVEGEEGRHLATPSAGCKSSPHDNFYAHPIEGLNAGRRHQDGWRSSGSTTTASYAGAATPLQLRPRVRHRRPRSHLRRIDVVQPEGVSFASKASTSAWDNWSLVIGFNAREAITLHDIQIRRTGRSLPRLARRDGRALRHAGDAALPQERLRHRRVRLRQARQLADARLRLPRPRSTISTC